MGKSVNVGVDIQSFVFVPEIVCKCKSIKRSPES